MYLKNREGHRFKNNMTLCPFHNDHRESMSVNQKEDGTWVWYCHSCSDGGTIINYIMKRYNLPKGESIERLSREFGLETPNKTKKYNSGESTPKKIKETKYYVYKNLEEKDFYRKAKQIYGDGSKDYWIELRDKNGWRKPRTNEKYERIPYNLHRFKDFDKIIVCEGEKDADTVCASTRALLGSSAPFGKSSWPDSINKYFSRFREVTFLYDVGNDEDAKKHAAKLKKAFPEKKIHIARVPLEQPESDITDYLNKFGDPLVYGLFEEQDRLKQVLDNAKEFKSEIENSRLKVYSYEDYMLRKMPKVEKLIDPFVEQNQFTLIGGMKGAGKSLFIIEMLMHLASGQPEFLNTKIERPARTLIIQQEISDSGFQQRFNLIRKEKTFNLQGRFFMLTTTGKPLKITNKEDFKKILEEVEEKQIEVLALDPLSTFNPKGENRFQDMKPIIDRISGLKTKISVVVTHHISSKLNPDNPVVPADLAGLYRGHTSLPDSADILIGLLRLPNLQRNQKLSLPFHNYCVVETELRNGERPKKFVIERPANCLMFRLSNVWDEIGKKILPGQIKELIGDSGGEIPQKELIDTLSESASRATIFKAIREAEKNSEIVRETREGKGSPLILKIRK